jgi:hypothetical protein
MLLLQRIYPFNQHHVCMCMCGCVSACDAKKEKKKVPQASKYCGMRDRHFLEKNKGRDWPLTRTNDQLLYRMKISLLIMDISSYNIQISRKVLLHK